MARLSNEDLERVRCSIAMLSPAGPAGLSRDEAIELLEELQRCRCRGRHLLAAVREIAATAENALGRPVTSAQRAEPALAPRRSDGGQDA